MTTVKAEDFKSFCDKFLCSVKESGKNTSDFLKEATEKFPVTDAAIQKRFRSYYKKSISEEINERKTPTRPEVIRWILESGNVAEFWQKSKLPNYMRVGFFDKWFGVSNFTKAKGKVFFETVDVDFKPSISENLSLVCSQVLGDGSYDKVRGSIRLSHGEKQIDYAIWKAGLFNIAFPTTKPAGGTSILTHTQGHKCSSWYSGRLPSKITGFIEQATVAELMEELTPFGILLYCLDDGYINLDTTRRTNTYVMIHLPFNEEAIKKMQEIFLSYGIGTTVSNKNLKIGTITGAVMFYKNFIEPFKNEIPACMHYKTELKI